MNSDRITLIADDFGLGKGHNAVILSLLEKGCIHGTSVLIDGDLSAENIEQLVRLRSNGCQIGLHLNLTHSFQDDHPRIPLSKLLRQAMTGRLPAMFGADMTRQARLFQQRFGFVPDFYDGHQHCHCLPGLVHIAMNLPREQNSWIRVPLPRSIRGLWLNLLSGGPKVLLLAAMAYSAGRCYRVEGWPTNRDFSGYLKLSDPRKVAHWLPRLIVAAGPGCLIMVHPGAANDMAQTPGHHPLSRRVEDKILYSRGCSGKLHLSHPGR